MSIASLGNIDTMLLCMHAITRQDGRHVPPIERWNGTRVRWETCQHCHVATIQLYTTGRCANCGDESRRLRAKSDVVPSLLEQQVS